MSTHSQRSAPDDRDAQNDPGAPDDRDAALAPESPEPRRLTDPRALRAIAHPIRMRLIGELAARGPARAADLAKQLDKPANSVSFHLRQLARYGLVAEDPERSTDRRERWWRVASSHGYRVDLAELRQLPGGAEAVGVFEQVTEGFAHGLVSAVYRRAAAEPSDQARTMLTDAGLHLSPGELDQFEEEMYRLVTRWMDRSRQFAASGDGVRRDTYMALMIAAPIDDVLGDEALGDGAQPGGEARAGDRQDRDPATAG